MPIRIKKRYIKYVIVVLLLGIFLFIFISFYRSSVGFFDENGLLKAGKLKTVNYELYPNQSFDNYNIDKIIYGSFGRNIYGFFLKPVGNKKVPGIVLLPGAGVDKASELGFAKQLAAEGFAVITIDQRGVGETGGNVSSLEEDFEAYKSGVLPVQHLMVFDALGAVSILRHEKVVDSSSIIIIGESLGGRIALISAALDKDVKGVIAISSAGFHYDSINDEKSAFIKSLDPDSYISMIAPREVVMLHSIYDKNVPFDSALITFEKAKELKLFVSINNTACNHGFCQPMFPIINSSLNRMVK